MSKTISTETGKATLCDDGSMILDNSGYIQHISASAVEKVWAGETVIPCSEEMMEEIYGDYDEEEAEEIISQGMATFNGEYFDFGEELHIVPGRDEFKD